MNWRLKGLLQKGISLLPRAPRVNGVLQKHFGALRDPDREIDSKITSDWLVFAEHLRTLGLTPQGLVFLEVGTGWFPALPICFALAGARAIETYDTTRLLDGPLSWRLVRRLEVHLERLAAASGQTLEAVRRRFAQLTGATSIEELLSRAGVRYHAPGDASRTRLQSGSVDIVFSNSVLEHVTPTALDAIMVESHRVVRPGGYVIHSVNCGDHYAYADRGITQVNYLRYRDLHWRLWNNELQFQNRLRASDFVRASEAAGFATVFARTTPKAELVAQVRRMNLPERFRSYTPEELAVTSIDFAGRRASEG